MKTKNQRMYEFFQSPLFSDSERKFLRSHVSDYANFEASAANAPMYDKNGIVNADRLFEQRPEARQYLVEADKIVGDNISRSFPGYFSNARDINGNRKFINTASAGIGA